MNRECLKSSLVALGVGTGDAVYVHTSLKSIGPIEGGPHELIGAFLDTLGPEGTLAVPTHSLSFTSIGHEPYDPDSSPCVTGAFPQCVMKSPSAFRSGHPSHSSAAIGAKAGYLTDNHCMTHALGFDSPLHRLYRMGGKVLLLGVGHTANTALHLAESLAGVPYTRNHYDPAWGEPSMLDGGGRIVSVPQEQYPGCSDNFGVMEGLLKHNGLIACGMVGYAVCQLMSMKDIVDFTVLLLKEQPDFLLCHRSECPACVPRRALLALIH
jgi:aminoglycoside 3-N-acetyltransferase